MLSAKAYWFFLISEIVLGSLAMQSYAPPNDSSELYALMTLCLILCLYKGLFLPKVTCLFLVNSNPLIPPNLFTHVLKMTSITPFKVSISDERIKRLQQRLALAELPSEVTNLNNPYSRGVPLSEMKRLALYWQNSFDWRAIEAKINEMPQYTANILLEGFDTYDIHFVHQRSHVPNAIPLLVLHGWPSSFLAVQPMLPLLVDGGIDEPSFHVVAPSLIDFGFSSANKMVFISKIYCTIFYSVGSS